MRKFTFVLLFFLLFTLPPFAQAQVPPDFGVQEGLLTPFEEGDASVTRAVALKTLRQVFPDYAWPEQWQAFNPSSACQLAFLKCQNFFPYGALDQKNFLLWWSFLETPEAEFKDESRRLARTWYHLRTQGWLPTHEAFTQEVFRTVLYRYQVSKGYLGLPYRPGMVLDLSEITRENYPRLKEVEQALNHLKEMIPALERTAYVSEEQKVLLKRLRESEQRFTQLKDELYQTKHPFSVVGHPLPEDIRQKIRDHHLNEVLAQVTYNYSKDIPGRRHNVLTGLQELNGRVYQPGQTINYFDVLRENGLGDYAMGYNLVGGKSEWGYGGGLCGSTTILFQAALNSGLFRPGEEGQVRYNHSALYPSLYPPHSIGKDAVTLFYSKTLLFKNHFDSPILFYSHNDDSKKEVTLSIFGNSPYASVTVSEAEKTGTNRYRVFQTLKPYEGPEETRPLDSYYPGGLR